MLIWKKDKNSVYIDANNECAMMFGFKDHRQMINITDYQVPCKLSELAEVYREHDAEVINSGKTLRLLEITLCANDTWKIYHTTKAPIYENGIITGTIAHAIDVADFLTMMPQLLSLISPNNEKLQESSYKIQNSKSNVALSKRQEECAFYLVRSKTSKEIANILDLSPKTIEYYIEFIKNKTGCDNRSQLIEYLINAGYLNSIPASLINRQLSIVLQ